MKRILPLIAALALTACVTPPIDETPLPRDGEMVRLNQVARVGTLTVVPLAVIEDSRCPTKVVCVWAGRATVRTLIKGAGWRQTLDLTLGEPRLVRGTTLTLTSVEPGKLVGAPPASMAYRFGFAGGR